MGYDCDYVRFVVEEDYAVVRVEHVLERTSKGTYGMHF